MKKDLLNIALVSVIVTIAGVGVYIYQKNKLLTDMSFTDGFIKKEETPVPEDNQIYDYNFFTNYWLATNEEH